MFILSIKYIFSIENPNTTIIDNPIDVSTQTADSPTTMPPIPTKPKPKKSVDTEEESSSSALSNKLLVKQIMESSKEQSSFEPSTDKSSITNDEEEKETKKSERNEHTIVENIQRYVNSIMECCERVNEYLNFCKGGNKSREKYEMGSDTDDHLGCRKKRKYKKGTIKSSKNVPIMKPDDDPNDFSQKQLKFEKYEEVFPKEHLSTVSSLEFPDVIPDSRPSQDSDNGVDEVDKHSSSGTGLKESSFPAFVRVAMFPDQMRKSIVQRRKRVSKLSLKIPEQIFEPNVKTTQPLEMKTKKKVPVTDLDEDSDENFKINEKLVESELKKKENPTSSNEKSKSSAPSMQKTGGIVL